MRTRNSNAAAALVESNEKHHQHQQESHESESDDLLARSLSLEEGAVADDEGLAEASTKRPRGRRLPKMSKMRRSGELSNDKRRVTIEAGAQSRVEVSKKEPLARGSDASGEDNDVDVTTSGAGTSDSDHGNKKRGNEKTQKPAVSRRLGGSKRTAADKRLRDEDDVSSENDESNSQHSSDAEDSSSSDDDGDDGADDDAPPEQLEVSAAEIRHAVALASEAAAKTFGWDCQHESKAYVSKKSASAGPGNALSGIIPGYSAPMRLEAPTTGSAMRGGGGGLAELRRQAERTDASTAHAVAGSRAQSVRAAAMQQHRGRGANNAMASSSSFKMGAKRVPDGTAGSGWFGMVPTALTDELKTDLAVIRNRTYLDPKRFYKSADKTNSNFVQLGTVIEGSAEYYSSRLTKKQRKSNITEETMADVATARYAKNQFHKVQRDKAAKYGPKKKKSRRGRGGF